METDRSDVPEDRCGFVLEPGGTVEFLAERYEAGSDEWYSFSAAVCCWRKVWDGGDRCIWHAETEDKSADALVADCADGPERFDGAYVPAIELGDAIDFEGCGLQGATFDGTGLQEASFRGVHGRMAQFPDAYLREAQFPDADLSGAEFPNADLGWARFPEADLRDAQFPDAFLFEAQFPSAVLTLAQFPEADLRGAEFPDATLPDAEFTDADLSGGVLSGARLHATQFDGATLDGADLTDTNLEGASLIEASLRGADLTGSKLLGADLAGAHVDADLAFGDHYPDAPERASATYRLLEQLFRDNSLPAMARRAVFMRKASTRGVYSQRVSEAVARRAVGPAVTNGARWLASQSTRVVTGYGQSPWRVVGVSAVLVVLFGALFPVWGVREGGLVYAYTDSSILTAANVRALVEGLVLSGKRFLAPSGSVQVPVGAAQAAAVVESYVGEFMFVLLAYVLGQRSAQ